MIANTPKPPYYAVIFTSILEGETISYTNMSAKMVELAQKQDGFLGIEAVRSEVGITVSYWNSLNAIQKWKQNLDHIEAMKKGRSTWYKKFKVRISKVERDYEFEK